MNQQTDEITATVVPRKRLTEMEAAELLELALDCAFDGNGPHNPAEFALLCAWVEEWANREPGDEH